MAERQCAELSAPADEEHIGADHQRPGAQLNRACKGRVEVTLGAGVEDMELQCKTARGGLRISRLDFRIRIIRIHQHANDAGVWNQLVQ